jgi:hypothetical protein
MGWILETGYCLGIGAILFAYGLSIYLAIKAQRNGIPRILIANTLALVIFLTLSRYLFPGFFHTVVFEGLLLHAGYTLIGVVAVSFGYFAYTSSGKERQSMSYVYGMCALLVAVLGSISMWGYSQWRISSDYPFASRNSLVETDPNNVRFTPPAIAHQQMLQRLGDSQYTIESNLVNAVDIDGGFGYAAPITPDGLVPIFSAKVKGVMIFDDRPEIPDGMQVRSVTEPNGWQVGEGMRISTNLQLNLYRNDPFADYQIYYLEVRPGSFLGVASRVKYRPTWMLTFVPYWDGVTLIYPDGHLEVLSVQQAQADVRLRGKRLYPENLARWQVEARRFDSGMWSGLYNRPGMIRIPTLQGSHEMPFLIDGLDKSQYWLIATEPNGTSYSLYRIYYVDAHDGTRSVYSCPAGLVGPDKAVQLIQSAPQFKSVNWKSEDKEGGEKESSSNVSLRAIETTYLTRGGQLYWKATVTNGQMSQVSFTVVMDALRTKTVNGFDDRASFQAWLEGKDVTLPLTVQSPDSQGKDLQEAKTLAKRLNSLLNK